MTETLSFKTIHASVRPQRIAILVDKSDEDWQNTCLRVIEFFSRLWGGAYNLIVPTDGKTIDERFWTILETFDPDRLYVYRKSGEDFRLSKPDQYQQTLDAHVSSWLTQSGRENPANADGVKERIDKELRASWTSGFAISPELQEQIKIRLAPFWFQQWIVEAGAIGAGSGVPFPLTDLTKIIMNTEHPDRFAIMNAPVGAIPRLWFGAVCGAFDEKTAEDFEGLAINRDLFDFDEGDLGRLVEFVVTGAIREPNAFRADKRNLFELNGITPFQLSMLQLGLYRSTKYQYWAQPLVLVAGNTIEDFCLYYSLSRLRDRVVWVLPSITETALNHRPDAASSPELSFIAQVRLEEISQQSQGGLACTSYSLTQDEFETVIERLNSSRLGRFRSPVRPADQIARLVQFPLAAVERDNFQRDLIVQVSVGRSISPFPTPKPKNFHTVHPYDHRYVTQLSVAQEAPPKHFDLGAWVVTGHNMTTHEVRVGKEGPAYFCPNVAYFGGDIDTVLVRPHLHLPPLDKLVMRLANTQGYECRPSDKGIYADETIAKWGGLSEVSRFLHDDAKRGILERFLDTAESEEGKGVYLRDDRRRYLDFRAIKTHVGEGAAGLVDELISKQILYRGFIFRCSFCRNSAWFSVSEVTQEFKCRRCGRSQVYNSANWKMPEEPSWFYKLDELVYQGYRHGMAVSLLALDYLRRNSENFSFATDREFWKPGGSRPAAEADLFCVSNGVFTIGEAKKENHLGKDTNEENGEIKKYRHIVAGLAARRLVFATFSDRWSTSTTERVISAFSDLPHVSLRFLAAAELLGPHEGLI